jgi:hypothetical protein
MMQGDALMKCRYLLQIFGGLAALIVVSSPVQRLLAGNVFVTGHDPDFHGVLGANATGAQNIILRGLDFARNGNTAPILYIETSTANNSLGDHTDSEAVLPLIGYSAGSTPGNHYVKVSATQFATATLANYSAIFVPSDHGGSLTGDDLAALDARATDIQNYVNSGGGLVALSEDGNRTPASVNPQPTNFGFLPFLVSAASVSQSENGFTVTPYGSTLGLTAADVNGNFSHSIFTSIGPFQVVDQDASSNVVTIALSGTVPEPSGFLLAGIGLAFIIGQRRANRLASPFCG